MHNYVGIFHMCTFSRWAIIFDNIWRSNRSRHYWFRYRAIRVKGTTTQVRLAFISSRKNRPISLHVSSVSSFSIWLQFQFLIFSSVIPPKIYYNIIMTAIKAAFAATVIFRIRSIVEMVSSYSMLPDFLLLIIVSRKCTIRTCCYMQNLFLPKTVYKSSPGITSVPSVLYCGLQFWCILPHFQPVPRPYFCLWTFLLLQVSALVHALQFFSWWADIAGDDENSDWKMLKDQLCDCGDANVAAFLSNDRRSNAVMQLSLATLSLLRPLRASVVSNSLLC